MNYVLPATIPTEQKQELLLNFSEDDFRDRVLRPIFLMEGLHHGEDLCGPDELGKDCYFWQEVPMTGKMIIALQTKRGDIKMSSHAKDNVLTAIIQLRMALSTPVRSLKDRANYKPDIAILATSGRINQKAKEHIISEMNDSRIRFHDFDSLVELIDQHMPELWYGINTTVLPYLSKLKENLCTTQECIDITPLVGRNKSYIPITDESYVPLYLHRMDIKREKSHGRYEEKFNYKQLLVEKVVTLSDKIILMMGDAGSGKSIALKRIAYSAAQRLTTDSHNEKIPIIFNAVELAAFEKDCTVFIAQLTSRMNPDSKPAFTLDDLESGRILLLVDGYDEIAKANERESFVEKIAAFHEKYKKCQIVITSRNTPHLSLLESKATFTLFNITPLDVDQAIKIADRLSNGQNLDESTTKEIIRRLENVHGIELNPLLVTIFVASSEYDRTEIPANITELFEKFTELMLGRWDTSKGLSQQHQTQIKKFILSGLALEMHKERVTKLDKERAQKIIEKLLEERGHKAEFSALYDEAVVRSGLMYELDNYVSFKHLMLQEYFAGRGICTSDFSADFLSDYWWTRTFVFNVGISPEDRSKITRLLELSENTNGSGKFQAGVTIGLALQACYLTKIDFRVSAFDSVISILTESFDDALSHIKKDHIGEIVGLLFGYLYGRDAVGSKLASIRFKELVETDQLKSKSDIEKFWLFAGIIEARDISVAEEELKKFSPANLNLLLALHAGLYHLENMQHATKIVKKLAKQIRAKVEPKIAHLKKIVFEQMKGYLLEIRKGNPKVLNVENEAEDSSDSDE